MSIGSQDIDAGANNQERVVVGLSGGPQGQMLIRRAAAMLAGCSGAELHAVHVRTSRTAGDMQAELDRQRTLVTGLGGTYHSLGSDDPAAALADFARGIGATQLVLGVSRGRKLPLRLSWRRGVGAGLVRLAGEADVHLVGHGLAAPAAAPPRRSPLGRGRLATGFLMAVLVPVMLQLGLGSWPHGHFTTDMLVQLTGTIAVALVGGLWPALAAAVISSAIVNFSAVHPVGTMSISDPENVLALVIFLAVAIAVSLVVGLSARRSREAAVAGAEAAALGELSRSTLAEHYTVENFMDRIREYFQSSGAGLYVRDADEGQDSAGSWRLLAGSGAVAAEPGGNDNVENLDAAHALAWPAGLLRPRIGTC